jgi:hypothetical protein
VSKPLGSVWDRTSARIATEQSSDAVFAISAACVESFGSPPGDFVNSFKTAWELLLLVAPGHDTKRAMLRHQFADESSRIVLSLRQPTMGVADRACHLPGTVVPSPDDDEFRLANRLGVISPRMMKAMRADLECAIVAEPIHLERAWNEISPHLAADVLPRAVQEGLLSDGESIVIVEELQVLCDQAAERLQVAGVEGIEQRGVETRNRLDQGIMCR